MISHHKHRSLLWYALTVLVFIIAAAALCWMIPQIVNSCQRIDAKKILDTSELKNRKFAVKVQETESGGIKSYLLSEHSNPLISISFIFRHSGAAYDKENRQGTAQMAAQLLTEGAGDYDEKTFKELLDENGIHLDFSVSEDDMSGTLAFPSANKDIAVELLQAALTEPHLQEDFLQMVRQRLLTILKLKQEKPQMVLDEGFRKNIFVSHPYSRPAIGTEDGIKAVTADDIREFLREHLSKSNLIVGVAGDIDKSETEKLLAAVFGKLPDKAVEDILPEFEFTADGREYAVAGNAAQAFAHLAAKGVRRDSADFYPLYMANYILGEAGLSSRLSKIIREKEGLTYGVYTYLTMRDAAALIEGEFSATSENFAKALELLKTEWIRIAEDGVSEKELTEAKKSLIASFNLRFAETENISAMLAAMQKYNLGQDFLDKRNDYIAGITLQEVNAAAKKYFSAVPDFVNLGTLDAEEK